MAAEFEAPAVVISWPEPANRVAKPEINKKILKFKTHVVKNT